MQSASDILYELPLGLRRKVVGKVMSPLISKLKILDGKDEAFAADFVWKLKRESYEAGVRGGHLRACTIIACRPC